MPQKIASLREKIHACSATESGKMIELYQDYLASLFEGFQVIWLASYRGEFGRKLWHTKAMKDWKIFDMKYPVGTDVNIVEASKKFYKKARETGAFGPQFMLSVNTAGKSRALLVTDAIPRKEWKKHWMSKVLAKHGVGERMVGAYTLSDTAESYFMIDRRPGEKFFDEKNRTDFYDAITSFPRLHYWLFLNRGLVKPAKRPLSPREQEVVQQLLGPASEIEIAHTLNLKKGTVHNYIVDIYKNYGVNSRYELVQLWLAEVPNQL